MYLSVRIKGSSNATCFNLFEPALPFFLWVLTKSLQLCPGLCNPMDFNPPGSSIYGILQARILERAAISSSRASSRTRAQIHISCLLHWQVCSLPLVPPGGKKYYPSLNYQIRGFWSSSWLLSRVQLFVTPWIVACLWLSSFSSLSVIRVVSSAYLRLLIFLLAILISTCASYSVAFLMMYSTYNLNKQGNSI